MSGQFSPSVVCFRTPTGTWAIDVRHARRVLPAAQLVALPAPLPGVVGLLEDPAGPLPVLRLDGGEDDPAAHVLELEAGGRRFGLLAQEVIGVVREPLMSPAPEGQDQVVVIAVVALEAGSALLLDAGALAARLGPANHVRALGSPS